MSPANCSFERIYREGDVLFHVLELLGANGEVKNRVRALIARTALAGGDYPLAQDHAAKLSAAAPDLAWPICADIARAEAYKDTPARLTMVRPPLPPLLALLQMNASAPHLTDGDERRLPRRWPTAPWKRWEGSSPSTAAWKLSTLLQSPRIGALGSCPRGSLPSFLPPRCVAEWLARLLLTLVVRSGKQRGRKPPGTPSIQMIPSTAQRTLFRITVRLLGKLLMVMAKIWSHAYGSGIFPWPSRAPSPRPR